MYIRPSRMLVQSGSGVCVFHAIPVRHSKSSSGIQSGGCRSAKSRELEDCRCGRSAQAGLAGRLPCGGGCIFGLHSLPWGVELWAQILHIVLLSRLNAKAPQVMSIFSGSSAFMWRGKPHVLITSLPRIHGVLSMHSAKAPRCGIATVTLWQHSYPHDAPLLSG